MENETKGCKTGIPAFEGTDLLTAIAPELSLVERGIVDAVAVARVADAATNKFFILMGKSQTADLPWTENIAQDRAPRILKRPQTGIIWTWYVRNWSARAFHNEGSETAIDEPISQLASLKCEI